MRIAAVDLLPVAIPLSKPYAVATYACDEARMVRVTLRSDDGTTGLGAASPEPEVNGETFAGCVDALTDAASWLPGCSFDAPADLAPRLRERLPRHPGARAAIDLALHDLWGRAHGRAVVDLLGRVHDALPTSVTIGVLDVAPTLAEARAHLARGFRMLKIKIGADLELDIERLIRLRELIGPSVPLLVDGNVGYSFPELQSLLLRTRHLHVGLVEQPLPPATSRAQTALPAADVRRLVADESLHGPDDAAALAAPPRPFGVWNVKLMKCGGITPALAIGRIAAANGIDLMWGCMDESVVGIAGALHAAFACPATHHLDLDGSFDLAADFARGGFELVDGLLRTNGRPGLGVDAVD